MNNYNIADKTTTQCFHCGNVPQAINAGFDISRLTEYALNEAVEYSWTCENCYKENYYKVKESRDSIAGLIKQLARFEPNQSTARFGGYRF